MGAVTHLPAQPRAAPSVRANRVPFARTACLAVMALASFLMFFRLDAVKAPIWDEAYYVTSSARYQQGQAQFASHPPLGLQLIAAGGAIFGTNDAQDLPRLAAARSIAGEDMPADYDYFALRALPALFGVLCAGLFFILMLEITGRTWAALMLSPLWLLDTALLAHLRAAHLDPFQIAFALAAMICAVRAMRSDKAMPVALFGLFVTMAALVRANAAMLVVCAPFLLWTCLRQRQWRRLTRRVLAGIGGALLAMAAVTASQAASEHALPDEATPTGRQDAQFISPLHRAAIATGQWSPRAISALWDDQRAAIAADLDGIALTDPNGSHPWQWLIGSGAIIYRWDGGANGYSVLAIVANVAVWLVSLAGVVLGLIGTVRGFDPLRAMLLAGWTASMAALAWLDQGRVLYLYHYFIPLLIGHALAAIAWRERGFPEKTANLAICASLACFAFAVPFALHQPVGEWRCAVVFGSCEGTP